MRRLVLAVVCSVLLLGVVGASAQDVTVEEIQDAIAAQGKQWTAGHNQAWDMHFDYGWYPANLMPPILTGTERRYQPLGLKDAPAQLDWRDMDGADFVTRVKNQMSCGSCWAFATVGPIEANILIQENRPGWDLNLSEQQMVSCCDSPGCNGCNGGFTTSSFDFAVSPGLVDESCFPYTAHDTTPCDDKCDDWEDRIYQIDDWEIIGEGVLDLIVPDPELIIDALQFGPVGTSLAIYNDIYAYESGVYETVIAIPQGFHAVTIVGYDIDEQYWICKNSWGAAWGESGYFRIRWGAAFIGAFTILPHYTAAGPEPDDDDDADDDATDDDATDDDATDDDATDDDATDDDATDDDATDDDAGPSDDDDDDDSGCGC